MTDIHISFFENVEHRLGIEQETLSGLIEVSTVLYVNISNQQLRRREDRQNDIGKGRSSSS